MNSPKTSLTLFLAIFSLLAIAFTIGCAKNSNPQPPIHDTVTVIKKDTLTDTLYATKPDPTVNLTKGLLLYLPFSGSIADSSGNGNPTQAIGSVLTYDAHGYANNAFGATGNGERVIVTNNGSIKFDTAFSLSFGFMLNAPSQTTFLGFVNPANGYGVSFSLGTTFPGNPYFDMGVSDSVAGCDNNDRNAPNWIVDTTGFKPIASNWYNVITVYHKGSLQIYLNGQLVSTKTGTGSKVQLCPAAQFVVGAWWNGDLESMNGKLDNIRLYNRVLTPNEIVKLSSNYQVTSNSYKPAVRIN